MTQVHAQMREQFRDVLSVAVPQRQPFHGKSVTERVERGFRFSRTGFDAGMAKQPHERSAGDIVAKRLSIPARKERLDGQIPQHVVPALGIDAQVSNDRRMQHHDAGLAELRVQDGKARWVRIQVCFIRLQPNGLSDSKARAGEQAKQGRQGQAVERLAKA